jgi:4'-phosphopantetheinyl transferase
MGAPQNHAARLIDSQRDSGASRLTGPRESGLSQSTALPSATAAAETQWALPPARTELIGNAVHVWRAGLDSLASELPDFARLLSASERKRADRFQFDRDRERFVVRRGLLRRILARYLACDPAEISFTYEARGKPSLANLIREGHPVHFNLSHSHGMALIAVTRQHALGVDVERVRPMPEIDQIAARFFSARENAMLNALPSDSTIEGFFHCWTRKEAYLKATGQGIAESLLEVEVSLTPGRPAELLSIAGDARAASLWTLHSLAPAPGFVGALAMKAKGTKPACWCWPEKSDTLHSG